MRNAAAAVDQGGASNHHAGEKFGIQCSTDFLYRLLITLSILSMQPSNVGCPIIDWLLCMNVENWPGLCLLLTGSRVT